MEKWKHEPDLDPEQPLAAAQRRKYDATHPHNAVTAAAAAKRREAARVAERKRVKQLEQRAALEAAKDATPFGAEPPPRGRRAHPDLVVGLAAAGVSRSKIAQVLHVNPGNVEKALDRQPGSRERIAALREELKGLKIARAHALEPKLWDRLAKEVGDVDPETQQWVGGEAKDVDAITRALLASEKIQAAAAGEAHASGAAEAPSGADLTVLVQALLSAPPA